MLALRDSGSSIFVSRQSRVSLRKNAPAWLSEASVTPVAGSQGLRQAMRYQTVPP